MAKGKVLIVDDDHAIVDFAVRVLVSEGYNVSVASNGMAALEQMRRFCPDVIVLDMMLPVMNGIEFLSARQTVSECSPPIIVVSAVDAYKPILSMQGVSDFLSKPLNLDDLLDLIAKHTENAS
jgi:two-component system, OmpR family, response regulator VicR